MPRGPSSQLVFTMLRLLRKMPLLTTATNENVQRWLRDAMVSLMPFSR